MGLGKLVVPSEKYFDLWRCYYSEPKNSVDAVFIGSSSIYRYWIPPQAYNEEGFTSVLLASSGQTLESTPYVIEEAAKTQQPQVYIVEVRKLPKARYQIIDGTYDIETPNYVTGRLISDMKPSLTKLKAAANLFIDKDFTYRMEWFFPVLKFHDNIFDLTAEDIVSRLSAPENRHKYATQIPNVTPYEAPVVEYTDKYYITQEDKDLIDTIARQAEKTGAKLLFLSTPYVMNSACYSIQEQMAQYMAEQGYDYLNLQDYVDEMGIVFATDFYNKNHVNINGARKITEFLAGYLRENYDMNQTHSSETQHQWTQAYLAWQEGENKLLAQYKERLTTKFFDQEESSSES